MLRVFCSIHTGPRGGLQSLWDPTANWPHHIAHWFQKSNTPACPWLSQREEPQSARRESTLQAQWCWFRGWFGKSGPASVSAHTGAALLLSIHTDMVDEVWVSSWVSIGKLLTCTADLNYIFCNHSAWMRGEFCTYHECETCTEAVTAQIKDLHCW